MASSADSSPGVLNAILQPLFPGTFALPFPTARRESLVNAFAVCLLTVCVLALFDDISFRQLDLSVRHPDNRELVFPFFSYWIDSLKQFGRLDVWNPYVWGGMPALGNPNIPMNPILYLLLHLSKPQFIVAMNLHLLVEIWAATLGFYFLGMRLGYGAFLSVVGALLYVLSTSASVAMAFYSTFFHFAVIPWLLYIVLTNPRRSFRWNLVCLTTMLYLQLTYGQLQFALYTFYFLLIAVLFLFGKEVGNRWRVLLTLGLSYVFAALLAAHALLPTFEFMQLYKDRITSDWVHFASGDRSTWRYLINLFMPEIFLTRSGMWPPGWDYWQSLFVYVHPLYSALFLFGLRRLGDPRARGLILFSVILLVLSTTTPGGVILVALAFGKTVPTARAACLLIFPMLFISLNELKAVLSSKNELRKFLFFLSVLTLAALTLRNEQVLRAYVESFFRESAERVPGAILALPAFWASKKAELIAIVQEKGWQLCTLLCFVASIFVFFDRKRLATIASMALVGFSLFQTVKFERSTRLRGADPYPFAELLQKTNPTLDFLRKQNWDLSLFEYYLKERNHEIGLVPNENAIEQIPAINGYSSIVPRNNELEPSIFRVNMGQPYTETLLKLLSIKYILVRPGLQLPSYFPAKMKEVLNDGRNHLLEYTGAVPRYYFPQKVLRTNREEILHQLRQPDIDTRHLSFSEELDYESPLGCHYGFEITERRMSERVLQVSNGCARSVLFALNVSAHPWWRILIDGKPVSAPGLNFLHRMVMVPPGLHRLEIRCVPMSVYAGLGISLGTLVLFAYLVVARREVRLGGAFRPAEAIPS